MQLSCVAVAVGKFLLKAPGTVDRAHIWMVRFLCTIKAVCSDVAAGGSDFFVDGELSKNTTLEAPDRISILSFLDSQALVPVAPSFLRHLWKCFSLETRC